MVDSEYSAKIYKFLNISIGTVMRNPEIIKFVFLIILKQNKYVSIQLKIYLIY